MTGSPAGPYVHHDGWLVPASEAVLPVGSVALRYGVSVFEGVRAYRRESGAVVPWLLEPQLRRLAGSCRLLELPAPAGVPAVVAEVLAANDVRAAAAVRCGPGGRPGVCGRVRADPAG